MYHTSPKRDGGWLQGLVYLLFIADTAHTVFTIIYVYESLIKHFGDVDYLSTADWVFSTDPALTGMIGGLVQAFFAWRVKVLTKRPWVALIILFCAAISFFMGIATAIATVIVPKFIEFQKFKVVVIIWLVSSSFADIAITGSLVFYLLYTNSLMSGLNARAFWQQTRGGDEDPASRKSAVIKLSTLNGNSNDYDRHIFVHVESDHANSEGMKIGRSRTPENEVEPRKRTEDDAV
ncbi:hypothetical protein DXG01_013795 [Tephrocybe rancida]|nr:hypothetical protein DXG01_013795 [Tephrocybe rancida]